MGIQFMLAKRYLRGEDSPGYLIVLELNHVNYSHDLESIVEVLWLALVFQLMNFHVGLLFLNKIAPT